MHIYIWHYDRDVWTDVLMMETPPISVVLCALSRVPRKLDQALEKWSRVSGGGVGWHPQYSVFTKISSLAQQHWHWALLSQQHLVRKVSIRKYKADWIRLKLLPWYFSNQFSNLYFNFTLYFLLPISSNWKSISFYLKTFFRIFPSVIEEDVREQSRHEEERDE